MKLQVALILSVACCGKLKFKIPMKKDLSFLYDIVFASPIEDPIAPSFDALRDVRFLLQTRANRGNPVEIQLGDLESVLQSVYRRDLPVRLS